jgi:AraC family transcriptional regulator
MKPATREDYLDRIRRVLRFVQEHLDDELSPSTLADVAQLSVYHFHRVFSGLVGESLAEHVRRIRLERAAGALRRTDDRVIDIALSAGYDAHEPFTRAFHTHFGMPPSAWRKQPEPVTFPQVLSGVHFGVDLAVSLFVPMMEHSKMIEVSIEKHPARRLLALAHEGDYRQIGSKFERLMGTAGSLGLLGPDSITIGIYYHDPDGTSVDELRSHACVRVSPAFDQAPDGFEIVDLPEGDVAIGVHRGPYTELEDSYRWLYGQRLPSSGREPADRPTYEIYVDDPETTKSEELRTLICIPLK